MPVDKKSLLAILVFTVRAKISQWSRDICWYDLLNVVNFDQDPNSLLLLTTLDPSVAKCWPVTGHSNLQYTPRTPTLVPGAGPRPSNQHSEAWSKSRDIIIDRMIYMQIAHSNLVFQNTHHASMLHFVIVMFIIYVTRDNRGKYWSRQLWIVLWFLYYLWCNTIAPCAPYSNYDNSKQEQARVATLSLVPIHE